MIFSPAVQGRGAIGQRSGPDEARQASEGLWRDHGPALQRQDRTKGESFMDVTEARDIANAALAGLTADVAEDLKLDDQGVCRLVFNDGGNIYAVLDAASADLIVWSPAGILPPEPPQQAEVLRRLMQANLFWGGTHGATLS